MATVFSPAHVSQAQVVNPGKRLSTITRRLGRLALALAVAGILVAPASPAFAQATCQGLQVTIFAVAAVVTNGTAGPDVILGTNGNDTINGKGGNDTICGQGGNDTIHGNGGIDTLVGGDGNDRLDGGPGNDTLDGLAGNDTYIGGPGNDVLVDGLVGQGGGSDTADYGSSTAGVIVRLDNSLPKNDGLGGQDGYDNIENVYGSNFNDQLIGDIVGNVILGRGGNDFMSGQAGNDTLTGSAGFDTADGGAGNDTCSAELIAPSC